MKYSRAHLRAWADRQAQYKRCIASGNFTEIVCKSCGLCSLGQNQNGDCTNCVLGPESRWCTEQLARDNFRTQACTDNPNAPLLAQDWLETMRAKARQNGVME